MSSLRELDPRYLAVPLLLGGIGLLLAYLTGHLPEWMAGTIVGLIVILTAAVSVTRGLLSEDGSHRRALVALGLGALVAVAAGTSLFGGIVPRDPIATGSVARDQPLRLSPAAHGSLRLAVHGDLPGKGAASGEVTLGIGDERFETTLSRRIVTTRAGRRGRAAQVHDETTSWLSVNVPSDVDAIQLVEADRAIQGPVEVRIFRDYTPTRVALPAALALLILVAWAAGRGGEGKAPVVAAGLALGFALAAHELAAPDVAVRREVGALISGGVVGGLSGALIALPFVGRPRKDRGASNARG